MQKETESVICPYDRNHIIDRSRLQRHLVKCSKNFPPNYKETCPFNATHLMFESELKAHIKDCPDRKYIDHDHFRFVLKNHGSINSCPPSVAESNIDHYDESWNDCLSDTFSASVSIVSNSSLASSVTKTLRNPKGRSEVFMVDLTEESNAEDVDSVASSAFVNGRGKFMQNPKTKNLPKVGRRLKPITDDLEIGASAITDVEDTESVINFGNGMGRGIVHSIGRKLISRYDSDTDDSRSTVSTIGRRPIRR